MTETHRRSEADVLFDHLKERSEQFGSLISYEELEAVLGRDLRENRAPLYAAKRRLQKQIKRSLRCEPGRGYRVPPAVEHLDMAEDRWGRADRQLGRARGELNATDVSALSHDERRLLEDALKKNRGMQTQIREIRKEVSRHDQWLAKLQGEVDHLKREPVRPSQADHIRQIVAEELARLRGE